MVLLEDLNGKALVRSPLEYCLGEKVMICKIVSYVFCARLLLVGRKYCCVFIFNFEACKFDRI